MARTVRKVSRTNTKGQKKENKFNKKWKISIIIVVLALLVGLGVGLGVYFGTKTENTYVSDKIYFNEKTLDNAGHEVTFNKENYQAIYRYLEDVENIFIFVYDGNAFYADEEDKDNYNEEYVKLIHRLADLQYTVDEAKKKGVDVELYVVDVAVDSATNVGILSDSKFGGFYSEDQLNYEPAFIYMKGEQFQKEVKFLNETDVEQSHIISTNSWTEVYSSSIKFAINYIQTL